MFTLILFCISLEVFFSSDASTQFRIMTSSYGTSGSHSLDPPHSVGDFSTSDQPEAEIFPWKHTTLNRDRHPCSRGIRNHSPGKRPAADARLGPRGHWDRLLSWDIKRYLVISVFRVWNVKSQDSVRTTDMCEIKTGVGAVYETMWENLVEPEKPQRAIWPMCIACWITKATDTHSEYVIIFYFPLQRRLN